MSAILVSLAAAMFLIVTPAPPPVPREVPFRLDAAGRVLVDVSLEGRAGFRFLLDTGATHSIVSPRVAAALGLEPSGETTMTSLGTARRVPVVRLSRVSFGPLLVPVDRVLCFEPETGPRAPDGVLGQDVLARSNYTVDYGRRRVRFDAAGGPVATVRGTRVPVTLMGGRPVVTIAAADGTEPSARLVLDSGTDRLVVFDEGLELLDAEVLPGRSALIRTFAGDRWTRRARVSRLVLGDATLEDLDAIVTPSPGRAIAGLLPLSLFDAVYINNRERYIVFNPRR